MLALILLAQAAAGSPAVASPGAVGLLVLESAPAAADRLANALRSADPAVRAAAARVLAVSAPPGGCEAVKAALPGEENPEARREVTRGIAALCPGASREASRKMPDLFVRTGPGSPMRPVARRPPLVRTAVDLPRGVALGIAKEAGCTLVNGALAVVERKARPDGSTESVKPLLAPPGSGCRRAALAIATLSSPPLDLERAPDGIDRIAVAFDEDALAAADEEPVGSPEPRVIPPEGGGPVREPKELLRVKPAYPDSLRRQRAQGEAVLTARIDREGRVKDLRVVEPAGSLVTVNRDGTTLDLEAIRAVSRWRYEPARVDGEAVPVLLAVWVSWTVR